MNTVTEEEAKQKWCQEVQYQIGPTGPGWQERAFTTRGDDFDPKAMCCIADQCMGWRWHEPDDRWRCEKCGARTKSTELKASSTCSGKIIHDRKGYCGKAGSVR